MAHLEQALSNSADTAGAKRKRTHHSPSPSTTITHDSSPITFLFIVASSLDREASTRAPGPEIDRGRTAITDDGRELCRHPRGFFPVRRALDPRPPNTVESPSMSSTA